MEKMNAKTDGATVDIVQENIERLRELFPDAFTESSVEGEPRFKVNLDALREILGDYVEDQQERYRFTWNGKARARRIAQTPSTGTLRPRPEESVNWDTTQNLFIEGDNLEVLKLLQKSYHKRVKMIYIDPPFNTGNEFIYPDRFADNLGTYLRYTGQVDDEGFKVSPNTETSGRYHTNWLNMMYPRLKLARNLLSDDGVMFISIDEHEVHNLRHLCDEVFGPENFVANIVWQSRTSISNDQEVSMNHNHTLVYSRNRDSLVFFGKQLNAREYSNPDGERIRDSRSTSHRDKAGAIRWAEAFSLNLAKAQFGIAKPKERVKAPTVIRGLVLWLRYHRQQSSDDTLRSYRSIGRKFWNFLRTKGVRRFDEVTREVLMEFRTCCLQKGNSRMTVDNNLIAIRAFLNWSLAKKWIGENPASASIAADKLFFRERPIRKVAYTREEYESIITTASGIDRHVFTLLGSWGLRISELAMLEWTDLDFDGGWVRICNKVTHDGIRYCPKDKTDRKIPLEGKRILSTLDQLGRRKGSAGYVLPLPPVKHRRRHAERRFIKQLKRLSKQTGITTGKLTLHRFRHYYVSECADAGVPMAITMAWVGHDELKMVLYYYSLRDEPAREAMRRFAKSDQSVDGAREDQDRRTGDAGKSEDAATDGADQSSSTPTNDQTNAAGPPAPSARGVSSKRMPGAAIGAPGADSKRGHQRADKQRRVS